MSRTGDFSKRTKEILAKRVSYRCSLEDCRRITIGPDSDETKFIQIGEAAHICAASPNGPRFDHSMKNEERHSLNNAIWLWANWASLIDRDTQKFTVEFLRESKEKAEEFAAKLLKDPSYRDNNPKIARLSDFLSESQILRNRIYEIPLPIADHDDWVDRVKSYLSENLNIYFKNMYSNSSRMPFYGDGSDRSKMERSLQGRTRRLNEIINILQ